MTTSEPPAPLVPVRSQPIIAAGVVVGLVAIAAWYVGLGGFRGGLVHHDAPPPATQTFTVNINAAGVAELSQLPGLGAVTAQKIVDHRSAHGPFAAHDDLLAVPGIGPVTLEGLLPHLRPIPQQKDAP